MPASATEDDDVHGRAEGDDVVVLGRRQAGGDTVTQRHRVSAQPRARKKCTANCERNKCRTAGAPASASIAASGTRARTPDHRIRSTCKDCGGAGICQHNRRKSEWTAAQHVLPQPHQAAQHVLPQPHQEQVQKMQGAPPQHIIPPALVPDASHPLLHSRA
jgi:hypothetical protein